MNKAKDFGTRIIEADRTPNIMRAIFHELKQNRVVITMCDEIEEWRPSRQNKILFPTPRHLQMLGPYFRYFVTRVKRVTAPLPPSDKWTPTG